MLFLANWNILISLDVKSLNMKSCDYNLLFLKKLEWDYSLCYRLTDPDYNKVYLAKLKWVWANECSILASYI
jgi:hypothetical protein